MSFIKMFFRGRRKEEVTQIEYSRYNYRRIKGNDKKLVQLKFDEISTLVA
jgi:hypothetical protein